MHLKLKRCLIIISYLICVLIIPVFIFAQFSIKGRSMNPVLLEGDRILVNKLLHGARIYKSYDFSAHSPLKSFRIPGLRNIQTGDIVVFNNTDPYGTGKIEFKINNVYAKRCIGCPGDTIGISNGYYYNRSMPDSTVIGNRLFQKTLSSVEDSLLRLNTFTSFIAYRNYDGSVWTIKDYGPLYIPSKGDTVALNPHNLKLYESPIEYETGSRPIYEDGHITINGQRLHKYIFKNNYYFLCGDNVLHSKDSRYMGLVPEEYIIGIAVMKIFPEFKKLS